MKKKYLCPKEDSEIVPLAWIFQDPVTTVRHATVVVEVERGTDPNPNAILYNNVIIYQGNTVIQVVSGGLNDVLYKFTMTATLSDDTVYVYVAYLPVVAV